MSDDALGDLGRTDGSMDDVLGTWLQSAGTATPLEPGAGDTDPGANDAFGDRPLGTFSTDPGGDPRTEGEADPVVDTGLTFAADGFLDSTAPDVSVPGEILGGDPGDGWFGFEPGLDDAGLTDGGPLPYH
jgi:hypothetical protein